MTEQATAPKKTSAGAKKTVRHFTGVVTSNKAEKTATVRVEFKRIHPQYKKRIVFHKNFLVHDEKNSCDEGDTVRIVSIRPRSTRKNWVIEEIVKKAVKKGAEK